MTALAILDNVRKVGRFDMLVMFMSDDERKSKYYTHAPSVVEPHSKTAIICKLSFPIRLYYPVQDKRKVAYQDVHGAWKQIAHSCQKHGITT